jgi:hypothetical protein
MLRNKGKNGGTEGPSVLKGGTKSLWPYITLDDKRVCPIKGKNCYAVTFDSYQEMLAHCRQNHPDRLPFGGEPTTEIVVTDTQGRALSWEEIGQILDDPSFWRQPRRVVRWGEEEVAPILIRRSAEVLTSEHTPRLNEVADRAVHA